MKVYAINCYVWTQTYVDSQDIFDAVSTLELISSSPSKDLSPNAYLFGGSRMSTKARPPIYYKLVSERCCSPLEHPTVVYTLTNLCTMQLPRSHCKLSKPGPLYRLAYVTSGMRCTSSNPSPSPWVKRESSRSHQTLSALVTCAKCELHVL